MCDKKNKIHRHLQREKKITANDLENILVRMRLKGSEGLNMWKRWKLPSR